MNITLMSKQIAGATELFARRHGPAVLTACGIAGFVTTNILTARAILKAQEPAKEIRLKLDRIRELEQSGEYGKRDRQLDRYDVGKDAVVIARIFAPAVAAGGVSVFCLLASHGMMRNKQLALAAAYTGLQEAYGAYRQRVRDELGDEKEAELYRSVKLVPREEGDEGPPCEIDYSDVMPSLYARFFDEGSPNWKKTAEYNHMFLDAQQAYANDRLKAYGFLFLNEVYEMIGIPRSQAGQIVGWKMNNGGDNFVTFGIHDIFDESSRAFVNGTEPVILLDFNVDGPIAI